MEHASFWEHLEELRRTLLGMLIAIAAGVVLSLYFYQPLLGLLGTPLDRIENMGQSEEVSIQRIRNTSDQSIEIPFRLHNELEDHTIVIPAGGEIEISLPIQKKKKPLALLGPLEGIATTLKLCFWSGLVLSSPIWLWLALQFIAPALQSRSRQLAIPFLLLTLLFFMIGFLFAHFVTLPLANNYLYNFNLEIGSNVWSFAHYFDYTILMLLANGLAAELSLILFFLVHYGVATAEVLISKRRHAIVAAFVLGALLTPPDLLTQFMLAIPLILFYEMAILYARFRKLKVPIKS